MNNERDNKKGVGFVRKKHAIIVLVALMLFAWDSEVYGQRRMSKANELYNEFGKSVFSIFGDRGQGTGFLISDAGLVLTNEHVVSGSNALSIQLSDSVKVRAKMVLKDVGKDIAFLAIHPMFVSGFTTLRFAIPNDSMVFIGEEIFTIGNPLNQSRVITKGVVSQYDAMKILSDVAVSPGNSGGPLMNMDGKVIGVTTYREEGTYGAGLTGSINIKAFKGLLDSALARYSGVDLDTNLLPIPPNEPFPIEALKNAALSKKYYDRAYHPTLIKPVRQFTVKISTPPYQYYLDKKEEVEFRNQRRKRNTRGIQKADTDLFSDLKDWNLASSKYSPVVTFRVRPNIGATPNLKDLVGDGWTQGYWGDLSDFKILRNGVVQDEYYRELDLVAFSVKKRMSTDKDLAQAGMFQYPISCFKPIDGKPPEITIEMESNRGKKAVIRYVLPEESVRRIWADFSPYTGDHVFDKVVQEEAERWNRLEKMNLYLAIYGIPTVLATLAYIAIQLA